MPKTKITNPLIDIGESEPIKTIYSTILRVLGKQTVMESINFEFLRKHTDWKTLADLGGFAEGYAHPDPVAAVVKLRSYAEVIVGWIYDSLKLPKPFRATFNDLLVNDAFQAVAPRVVLAKLHAMRKEGNRAAHGTGRRRRERRLPDGRGARAHHSLRTRHGGGHALLRRRFFTGRRGGLGARPDS